jgi:hypothetical protein
MAPAAVASGPSFDKERIALYESKITGSVILIAIVAASGGLLFGACPAAPACGQPGGTPRQRKPARRRAAPRTERNPGPASPPSSPVAAHAGAPAVQHAARSRGPKRRLAAPRPW